MKKVVQNKIVYNKERKKELAKLAIILGMTLEELITKIKS